MRVINECRVDFQYKLASKSPLIMKTKFSNIVTTDIIKDILKIKKCVDKKFTTTFDILKYTIIISNISKSTLTNIYFLDKIPRGTKFIDGSLEINEIKQQNLHPEKGFYLYNMTPNSTIKIDFKVLILPCCYIETIKNFSKITHDYIYNIEKPPDRVCINSNVVCSDIKYNLFKNINIKNIIKVKECICEIDDFNINTKIIDVKLVNSPLKNIYRNYKMNFCRIIIIGIIEYNVCYKKKSKSKIKKNNIKREYGFSTSMVVPVGISYGCKNKIKINIEYASMNIIDKNNIFASTNLAIYY